MQALWLPAHSESFTRQLTRLGLWQISDPVSPLYYPHALISYAHWTTSRPSMQARNNPKVGASGGRRGPKSRDHAVPFKRDAGAYVFGDSGGFTIRTLGMKFDPVDVIRWQGGVCSVGVILDVPTFNNTGARIWEQAVRETCMMTQKALPAYLKLREQGSPFRWWGVIHGMPNGEREEWMDKVSAIYPFTDEGEGWSILPQPIQVNRVTPRAVASVMRFAMERKIKRLHVLMCTQPACVATLLCLQAESGVEFLTYDSSTFAMSGTKRTAIVPTENKLSYEVTDEQFRATTQAAKKPRPVSAITGKAVPASAVDSEARDYLLKECECGSCRQWREDLKKDEAYWMQDSRVGYRFSLHNFAIQKQTFAHLTASAHSDPEHTLRELLGKDWGIVRRAFDGRESITTQTGSYRSLLDY